MPTITNGNTIACIDKRAELDLNHAKRELKGTGPKSGPHALTSEQRRYVNYVKGSCFLKVIDYKGNIHKTTDWKNIHWKSLKSLVDSWLGDLKKGKEVIVPLTVKYKRKNVDVEIYWHDIDRYAQRSLTQLVDVAVLRAHDQKCLNVIQCPLHNVPMVIDFINHMLLKVK